MSTAHGLLLGTLVVAESAALACLLAELTLRDIGRVTHGGNTQGIDHALASDRTPVTLRHIARSVTGAGRKFAALGAATPGRLCFLSPRGAGDLRLSPAGPAGGPAEGCSVAARREASWLVSGPQGRSEGPSRSVAITDVTTERAHARRVTQGGVTLIHSEGCHDA